MARRGGRRSLQQADQRLGLSALIKNKQRRAQMRLRVITGSYFLSLALATRLLHHVCYLKPRTYIDTQTILYIRADGSHTLSNFQMEKHRATERADPIWISFSGQSSTLAIYYKYRTAQAVGL